MTPLYQAIEQYIRQDMARLHTPGHKGVLPAPLAQAAPWDITEIRGADSLFHADGPLARLEERYAKVYGAVATCISAGGSTLCIQAMLALVAPLGRRVLMGRNVHGSAVNAMALLGLEPVWLYPDQDSGEGLPGTVSPQLVEEALAANDDVAGVYLTSPDYFGVMGDIAAVAQVCHRHGKPLLVDNAHGAHLPFCGPGLHPMALGADLCCDSLHKTMPVLTGGALLHIGNPRFVHRAKGAMAMFGSTSPSYLVLLSIDLLLEQLEGDPFSPWRKTCTVVDWLTRLAAAKGFGIPQGRRDPARLSLGFAVMGYTWAEFDALLTRFGIEPEYQSEGHCVLLLAPATREEDIGRIVSLIDHCRQREPIPLPRGPVHRPRQAVPLRTAALSPTVTVALEEAVGRVAAQVVTRCPPGIPLVVPGEEIDALTKNSCKKYGVCTLDVLQ